MIVCFTSFGSVGCTFLDWSFHFLLGKDSFWKDGVGWVPLSKNPLKSKNAHGHLKNHPGNTNQWCAIIKNFKSYDKGFPLSFYGFLEDSSISPLEDVAQQYLKNIDLALKKKIKVIYVHKSHFYPYFKERSSNPANFLKELQSWCLFWFPTIKNIESKIESIGGMRDFLSYNMRYIRAKQLKEKIKNEIEKIQNNLLFLDCKDWWVDGLKIMEKIFNFLELSICQHRVSDWVTIYKEWNKLFLKYDKFEKLLPIIAESVVKGKKFNLETLDLNIIEEALILEKLMLEYGVRLKIKNLDIFPKNTLDLHNFIKK